MRDLIDTHRANIAKAGVTLAEAIAEATTAYTLAVAASEAELDVQMSRRLSLFHGDALIEPAVVIDPLPPVTQLRLPERKSYGQVQTVEKTDQALPDREGVRNPAT